MEIKLIEQLKKYLMKEAMESEDKYWELQDCKSGELKNLRLSFATKRNACIGILHEIERLQEQL